MPKGFKGDTKHKHYPDAQGNLPAQEGQSSQGVQKAPAFRPSVATGGGQGKKAQKGRDHVTGGGGSKVAKRHNPY